MSGVDEVDAGSDVETASSADEDEAAGVGFVESGNEGAGGFDEVVHVAGSGPVGADDGVGTDGLGSDVVGIEDVSFEGGHGRVSRNLGGVTDDGGDAMSAGDELVEDAAADHSGGGVEDDVHGASLRCAQG